MRFTADLPSLVPKIKDLLASSESAQAILIHRDEELLHWQESETPVDVYAVQKGILTLLIGIAEEQYLIETLDHVNHILDPQWTKLSPWDEAKLSIETLLEMTTGMDDDLSPLGEVNVTWRYNNTAYNYLKQILTVQSGMSLQELSEEWLFKPLGMTDTKWVDRPIMLPNGLPITGLESSARDLSLIGRLVMNQGEWLGKPLVPKHFIRKMLEQGPEQNPAWSWGWWNNFSSHFITPMKEEKGTLMGKLIPEVADDLVAARGAYGNYLYVLPSENLIIARTCLPKGHRPAVSFETQLWHLLTNSG